MGYLTNFIVYTFAMAGVIVFAVLVFKASTTGVKKGSTKNLKVIDTLSLAPRKNLYIVSVGEEKFLIAGDADRTCLISKLESTICKEELNISQDCSKVNTPNIPRRQNYMDRLELGMYSSENTKAYDSVMKSMAEKMKTKL